MSFVLAFLLSVKLKELAEENSMEKEFRSVLLIFVMILFRRAVPKFITVVSKIHLVSALVYFILYTTQSIFINYLLLQ